MKFFSAFLIASAALISTVTGSGYGSAGTQNGYAVNPPTNNYQPGGYYPVYPQWPGHHHHHDHFPQTPFDPQVLHWCWKLKLQGNFHSFYWKSYCRHFLDEHSGGPNPGHPGHHETDKERCERLINRQIQEDRQTVRSLHTRIHSLKDKVRQLEWSNTWGQNTGAIKALKDQIQLLEDQMYRLNTDIVKKVEERKECGSTTTPKPETPECKAAKKEAAILSDRFEGLLKNLGKYQRDLKHCIRHTPHDHFQIRRLERLIEEQNRKIKELDALLKAAVTAASVACGEIPPTESCEDIVAQVVVNQNKLAEILSTLDARRRDYLAKLDAIPAPFSGTRPTKTQFREMFAAKKLVDQEYSKLNETHVLIQVGIQAAEACNSSVIIPKTPEPECNELIEQATIIYTIFLKLSEQIQYFIYGYNIELSKPDKDLDRIIKAKNRLTEKGEELINYQIFIVLYNDLIEDKCPESVARAALTASKAALTASEAALTASKAALTAPAAASTTTTTAASTTDSTTTTAASTTDSTTTTAASTTDSTTTTTASTTTTAASTIDSTTTTVSTEAFTAA
uniref:Salivary secreted protein n=1 Tax=Rhabditophanes sp. KR3021 TaxID=114890 RepID=A0AC35UE03_9BILA